MSHHPGCPCNSSNCATCTCERIELRQNTEALERHAEALRSDESLRSELADEKQRREDAERLNKTNYGAARDYMESYDKAKVENARLRGLLVEVRTALLAAGWREDDLLRRLRIEIAPSNSDCKGNCSQ